MCAPCLREQRRAAELGWRTLAALAVAGPLWVWVVLISGPHPDVVVSAIAAVLPPIVALFGWRWRERRVARPWLAWVVEYDQESLRIGVRPAASPGRSDPFRRAGSPFSGCAPEVDIPGRASAHGGIIVAAALGLIAAVAVLGVPRYFPWVAFDNPSARPWAVVVDGTRIEIPGQHRIGRRLHIGEYTFEILSPDGDREREVFEVVAGMRHLMAVPSEGCYVEQESNTIESRIAKSTTRYVYSTRRGPARWHAHDGGMNAIDCATRPSFLQ